MGNAAVFVLTGMTIFSGTFVDPTFNQPHDKNMSTKIEKGQIPHIGASGMRTLFTGWTSPDPANCAPDVVEGYHVDNYFDSQGRYKGADEFGVEPTFREMTHEEISEYLANEV